MHKILHGHQQQGFWPLQDTGSRNRTEPVTQHTYVHNYTYIPPCTLQAHLHQGSFPLWENFMVELNWTGCLLLNPMERCTMSYTTHQKVAQNSQLTLGVTWPTTTWQDLRGTECTPTMQCRSLPGWEVREEWSNSSVQPHTTCWWVMRLTWLYTCFHGMQCIEYNKHMNFVIYIITTLTLFYFSYYYPSRTCSINWITQHIR